MHAFGICGSQASGIIEYLGRWLVDEAAPSGMGGARRRDRRAPGPRRLHRTRERARGRARPLRGVRRRSRRRRLGRAAWTASVACGSWSSSRSSPIRAARSLSRTWTAHSGCASSTGSARRGRGHPVPHGGRARSPALGAAGGQARAAQRLRGEVQPSVPDRGRSWSGGGPGSPSSRTTRSVTQRCSTWRGA